MMKTNRRLVAIALLITPVLAGCDENLQIIGINQLSAAAGTFQEAFVAQLVGPIVRDVLNLDPPTPAGPEQFEITIINVDQPGEPTP